MLYFGHMLETILSCIVILNASSIGLGVGSSTLAIASFLTALKDGTIDESERRMLGVIYVTLRVAMVLILLTTVALAWLRPETFGDNTPFLFILTGVLYLNAVLMTKHWIPSSIGPALQAATWYTLGFVATITMFQLFELTYPNFALLYAADIVFAVLVVKFFLARARAAKK